MENAFIQSLSLVTLSEMGDKTQLLALALISRFKAPWQIMFGIFFATIANHLLAAYVGTTAAAYLSEPVLRWILVALYGGFALWALIPDKDDDSAKKGGNAFLTTLVTFFLAEMGDKTQLATVSLGAAYKQDLIWVTTGTTLGMMIADGLAVFSGPQLLQKIPMKIFRILTALLFAFFAVRLALGSDL